MLLSVCIPTAGRSWAVVAQALGSAQAAALPGTEILLAPQGSDPPRERVPAGVRVLPPIPEAGLVENWNRCLTESQGRLIHILHDDDLVTPGFYEAIVEMERRFPEASLYATGMTYFLGDAGRTSRRAPAGSPPERFEGAAAARLILAGNAHCCGSVVISRRVVRALGPFDPAFPYCPDEEAYLRFASLGGIVVDRRRLYLERVWPGQLRYRTWERPDFVPTYFAARVQGAARYGDEIRERARRAAANVTLKVITSNLLDGRIEAADRNLRELLALYPRATELRRYGRMRAGRRSRFLRGLARARRSLRRRLGRP